MLKGLSMLVLSSFLWAESISLEEILDYASKNAQSLKIKETDAMIESTNIQSAESAYYPSLNVVYNGEYNKALDGIPLGSETIGGVTIANGTRYQSSVAFSLNYDLYHFGATDKHVDIAWAEYNIKRTEWCSLENELHQRILEHYVSARKLSTEYEYKNKMLILHKKLFSIETRLYKVGQYSKIDLGDEAISIITLDSEIKDISILYQDEINKLSTLSYKNISNDTKLLPLINKENTQPDTYNNTINSIILQKKISQKVDEISLQSREQMPSLGAYSSYYYYGSDPDRYKESFSKLGEKSWNVGLALRFNIFEGFKHSAKSKRLSLELQRLKQEYTEAEHEFNYEVQVRINKVKDLEYLKKNEQQLVDRNYKKVGMLKRLRKSKKVDMITEINAEYALLERTLNMKIRNIDMLFEAMSLSILKRGVTQCSLR